MEKKVPLADVQSHENIGQSSSPYREIELSDAQKAFQEIVNVIDSHENCSCVAKQDLTEQIKLIADEIVKSKIRDKLLLSSKTDLNTKFAQLEINKNKQKEKREGELFKLKSQIVAQTTSIGNQAKYLNTLLGKVQSFNEKVETLKIENVKLNEEVETLKIENVKLNEEFETLKTENEKLSEKNNELLAQVNEMLQ